MNQGRIEQVGTPDEVYDVKLGKLLFLLAWPLWLLVKSSVSALFVRLPAPQGEEITRSQAPAMFNAMDDMRRRMKGPRFHHVLITDDVNAAVMQRPLFGLFGWPRNYLILGLPLLESLSPQEALAVVAHEYGHLAGSHSRFGAYIYRLRNSWGTVQELAQRWEGWSGKPMQKLVGWYAPYFNAYTFVLARANEYQADAASAELVGANVAASALKRVHLAVAHRDVFMKEVIDGIATQEQPPHDLAWQWAQHVRRDPGEGFALGWLRDALARQTDATDTHPALTQRLAALLRAGPDVEMLPAPIDGSSAADAWLGAHVAKLRTHMQNAWRERVAEPWAERHQEWQRQKQRLVVLNEQAELSQEERLERIRLRMQLEPSHDARPDLIEFNHDFADHAVALYLEADLRLDKDDESGLALLDRVMTLDPEAIKPACERAFAFLTKRGAKDGARVYEERWNARTQMEQQRAMQMHRLDVAHELRNPDDLPADACDKAVLIVRTVGASVQQAYLVRRVLPADPSLPTYVLIVKLSLWARLRKRHGKVVDDLAAHQWPMHLQICTMHGEFAKLEKKVAPLFQAALL
jgi:Zn-dependent protease with chaperone function